MPVWGAVISTGQVGELVTYIHAGLPRCPQRHHRRSRQDKSRRRGQRALCARRLHQLSRAERARRSTQPAVAGQDDPPLTGEDFRAEFNTDAKIIDVIRSGSVIGRAPIVSMPHWGGIIPTADLQALTAYLKTLK